MTATRFSRKGSKPKEKVPLVERLSGYIFILPALAIMIFFLYLPVIYSFVISFFNYDLFFHKISWVGLANYEHVINSSIWWLSIYNAIEYTLIVVTAQTILAFFLAQLFSQRTKLSSITRAIVFIPAVSSSAVMSTLAIWFFSPTGLFNYILAPLGVPANNWLLSTTWAFPAIMALNIFSTIPTFMIMFVAGLQSIPSSIMEAASIDGLTNPLRRFRYIYFPLLRFIFVLVILLGIVGSMQLFDQIFFMTQGGPGYSTYVPLFYIYDAFATNSNLGIAASSSFLLFIVIMALVLIEMRILPEYRWS